MLTRFVASIMLAAVAMVGRSAPMTSVPGASVHSSRVTFTTVTRVCDSLLLGDYVVVHDDEKMAAGEPCTTFYRLKGDHAEAAVSFHCIPRDRPLVDKTTIVTRPASGASTASAIRELVEYQIAGDSEAHGVPGLR